MTAFAVPSYAADRYRAQMLVARAPDPEVVATAQAVARGRYLGDLPPHATQGWPEPPPNVRGGMSVPGNAPRTANGVQQKRSGVAPTVPRLAADIRFVTWAVSRFRTFLQERWNSAYRWGRRYMLARTFVISHAGGPATKAVAVERDAICGACPHRIVRSGRAFCQSCGCGYHRLATLPRKNRLAWYKCPRGRFDATKGFVQLWQTKSRK